MGLRWGINSAVNLTESLKICAMLEGGRSGAVLIASLLSIWYCFNGAHLLQMVGEWCWLDGETLFGRGRFFERKGHGELPTLSFNARLCPPSLPSLSFCLSLPPFLFSFFFELDKTLPLKCGLF